MALGLTSLLPVEFGKKVLRSQIQYFFLSMLLALIPFILGFLQSFTSIVSELKQANPAYPWPAYSDLLKALLTTVFLLVANAIFTKFFTPYAEWCISAKYKGKERYFKTHKFVDCVFKGSYYLFAFCFGYYAVKDTDFLTPMLGGRGNSVNMFKDYPYQEIKNYELIRNYLMVQLGYHLYSLTVHVCREPKNDFIEMLLHHLMTVLLIGLAYLMNYVPISVGVLLCHDFSDVLGYVVRTIVDTSLKKMTLVAYFGLLISWFYSRLIVFPFDVIRFGIYMDPKVLQLQGTLLMTVMLHILIILHVYWFYLFIQMGLRFVKTKETQDTYHIE
jgi:hypothetical protein